jgi:hypothetical protein
MEREKELPPKERIELIYNFGTYNNTVEEFKRVFEENYTKEETKSMLQKLNCLNIKERWNHLDRSLEYIPLGYYNSEFNCIVLERYDDPDFDEDVNQTLLHELFHMASTKKIGDTLVTGLEIPGEIGFALNEGYTELLTKKYFSNKKVSDKNSFLAAGIESIVGSEKMQEFFINANFNGLVMELSKYSSREDVLKLIYAMDNYNGAIYNSKLYRNIVHEIARMNAVKLRESYDNQEITKEEFEEQYIKKVSEYRKYRLWNDDSQVIRSNNELFLSSDEVESDHYESTEDRPYIKK